MASERSVCVAELQAKFKATMTAATMAGRWCSLKDGVLGEENEDCVLTRARFHLVPFGGSVWES